MPHPATLLLIWIAFAIGLQWIEWAWLAGAAVLCSLLASLVARKRIANLLRRSRWLMLSLALLYLFATPGEYLPGIAGDIGLTREGLHQGAEQLGRLLALLSSLAILHQVVGTDGLLAGLHTLLKPFPGRTSTVVRLMLVLDHVEQERRIGWREWLTPQGHDREALPDRLSLAVPVWRWFDGVLLLCAGGALLAVAFRP